MDRRNTYKAGVVVLSLAGPHVLNTSFALRQLINRRVGNARATPVRRRATPCDAVRRFSSSTSQWLIKWLTHGNASSQSITGQSTRIMNQPFNGRHASILYCYS